MIENAEKVVSRMDIADKVWNTHFDTGTNFIDVYINYLRKKIDRDFDTKLIHTRQAWDLFSPISYENKKYPYRSNMQVSRPLSFSCLWPLSIV